MTFAVSAPVSSMHAAAVFPASRPPPLSPSVALPLHRRRRSRHVETGRHVSGVPALVMINPNQT